MFYFFLVDSYNYFLRDTRRCLIELQDIKMGADVKVGPKLCVLIQIMAVL